LSYADHSFNFTVRILQNELEKEHRYFAAVSLIYVFSGRLMKVLF